MMWELSRKERIGRNRDKPGHDGKGGTLPPHEAGPDAKGGAA